MDSSQSAAEIAQNDASGLDSGDGSKPMPTADNAAAAILDAAVPSVAEPGETSLEWMRQRLQAEADRTGVSWLLMDGFCHQGISRDTASGMTFAHGVPSDIATPAERQQAIEEIIPRLVDAAAQKLQEEA